MIQGVDQLAKQPDIFIYLIVGVLFGMIMGVLPGLSTTLAVTIVLPFTYVMTPYHGLATLVGAYVGGTAGGLVAACLLNIPGTPGSLVTCFDGAPMARNGRASDALTLGVFSSMIGGLFSAIILFALAPKLARVSLMFGPWEYFALGMLGLSVVIGIASSNMLKGVIMATLGIFLSMIGFDSVSGIPRMTMGFWQLGAGLDSLPTMMGLFAVVEIMNQTRTLGVKTTVLETGKIRFFPRKGLMSGPESWRTMLIGSVCGTFIGILPGLGATTGSMFAYNTSRSISKTPEKYGTGFEDGVIASESANNAVCGGALVPMLTLGIPGDLVTSIMMGGLIMHGLTPGPLLFTNSADIIGVVFITFAIANVLMYIFEMGLMNAFIRALNTPMHFLFPIIVVLCVVGTITVHNRMFDCYVLIFTGLVGYLLVNNGFPLSPIILGYILNPTIEKYFRTGVVLSKGNPLGFLSSPLACVILIFAVLFLAIPIWQQKKNAAKAAAAAAQATEE